MTTSCFKDVHRSILKTADANNNKVEMKVKISGCCGCKTFYVNSYRGKNVQEQWVSEWVCGFGEPTKFQFQYTPAGDMTIAYRLIAVYDTSYVTPVTDFERGIFRQFDSILTANNVTGSKKPYSAITGFRTPKGNEKTHPFAIGKKGKAIY
jgi:hypothetical protein